MSLSLPPRTSPPSEKEGRPSGDMEQRGNQTSSPAPSNNNNSSSSHHDIPDGFQQLIDHNNNEPTPSYSLPPEEQQQQQQAPLHPNMYSHNSNPPSGYSSPAPQYHHQPDMSGYEPSIKEDSPYSYPPIPYQQGYDADNSPYPPPPETVTTPHHSYSTPATSPPTPSQSDAMRTRSGKAIRTSQTTSGSSRPYRADPYSKPPPPPKPAATRAKSTKKSKKAAAADKEEDGEFILDAPLSELCVDMASVTEIDIDAYAKRTIEVRRAEVVRSKNGKTKRPSNAFMLYRKAYQNRAKELKKHDNHQVVSKVCGSSWRREDPRVKAYFTDLARIESELHHTAFPDYKFAPAKARNRAGKGGPAAAAAATGSGAAGNHHPYNLRRGGSPDGEDSELELADFDYATQPPSRTASRATHYDMHHPDAEYMPPGGYNPYMQQHHNNNSPHLQQQQQQHMMYHQQSPPPPHHMSSYEYSNPGRPKPQPYGTLAGGGGPGGGGGGGGNQSYLQKTAELSHQQQQQQQQQMYPPYGNSGGSGGMAAMPFGGPGVPGLPGHVENVYIHRTDSPGSVYASAGASPILPPHGGGGVQYGNGGMMNAMYGAPLHQQHGLTHPMPQHHQQQQLHHHNQNIDPSLMAPPLQQQQDEVRSVASMSNDPYDGPLGIYTADGGNEFSLGGYGDPIYQPTPPPQLQQQFQPPPPQHQQQHRQRPHHQQSNHELMVADDDLWKIEPTALDDPFDFDLLEGRSPDPDPQEEEGGVGGGAELKGDGRGDGDEGAAAAVTATDGGPGGGAADDDS